MPASRLRQCVAYRPSWAPTGSHSTRSSSSVAARPGAYSSPVDRPAAPASIASRTMPRRVSSSCRVSGRGAKPATLSRSAPWGTSGTTCTAGRADPERRDVRLERPRHDRMRPRPPAAERRHRRRLGRVGRHGRQPVPAVPDRHRRDPLEHARLRAPVDEQRRVGVRVDVDDARRDDEPAHVEHGVARARQRVADRRHAPAGERDVRAPRRGAGPVDDRPAGQQERVSHAIPATTRARPAAGSRRTAA